MTAIELRAELFREINPLLDNESAMTKMLAFVKSLVPAKKRRWNQIGQTVLLVLGKTAVQQKKSLVIFAKAEQLIAENLNYEKISA